MNPQDDTLVDPGKRRLSEHEASVSKKQRKTEDVGAENQEVRLALQLKQFEVYEGLLANSIPRLNDKAYYEIIKDYDEESKDKLVEIHKKFIINPSEKHLIALIERTRIYFEGQREASQQPFYNSLITKVYEELNRIPEIRVCLRFVSYFTNLRINLDINQESVVYFDSRASADVNGRTSNEVFVGAKGFNWSHGGEGKRDDYLKVLGVLAHELFHFAILYRYNNDYKPYHKDDDESKNKFEEVLKATNGKRKFGDEIINSSLNVEEKVLHDELIVCVPHILARYKESEEKLKQLKDDFSDLFDLFDEKTLPDLSNQIELLPAVSELKPMEPQSLSQSKISLKPSEINYDLETDKFFEISSNCPQLTLHMIYQQMHKMSTLPTSFIFLTLDQATIDLVKKAFDSCWQPTFIFDCENKESSEVVKFTESMEAKGINKRIIFVHNSENNVIENAVHQKLSHSWDQLEEVSKENLIKRKTEFQGKEICLDRIVDVSSKALGKIPLNSLLNNRLKIGKKFKFSDDEIYIGRKFSHGNFEIETNQLVENAKNEKIILLSADAGMGKTTELKMLATKFKESLPTYWVAFIDLKKHYKFYDKGEKVKTVFRSSEDIATFFAAKIFAAKLDNFEADIFKELFQRNRVVLLMDGFDEICPTFNVFMTNLLSAVRDLSKNILIISTRQNHKLKLEDILDAKTYNFCPLTDKNCKDLIEKYFEKRKFLEGDFDKVFQNTKVFLSKLNDHEEMNNPMLLTMVAEVFTSNDEIAEAAEPNIFWIYNEFVNIMIGELYGKGDVIIREHVNATKKYPIRHFYQKEAFKVFYDDEEIDALGLEDFFKDNQTPQENFKTRSGLMKLESPRNFQFIHRTFAEFFVAESFFTNLFDPRNKNVDENRKNAVKKLFQECCEGAIEELLIFSFLDGAFEALLKEDCSAIDDSLYEQFFEILDWKIVNELFFDWVDYEYINLVTVATRRFRGDRKKLLELWICEDANEPNSFIDLAMYRTLNINEKLFNLVQEVFSKKDIQKYFIFDRGCRSVIRSALQNDDPSLADFYCDRVTNLFRKSRKIMRKSFYPVNALRKHLLSNDLTKFQEELDQIESEHGLVYLKRLLAFKLLDESKTIYFKACEVLNSLEDFEFLWDALKNKMGDDVQKAFHEGDVNYKTPLMYKTKKCDKVFMKFWELISDPQSSQQLLNATGYCGYNVFYHATQSTHPDTFIAIKNLYLKIVGEEKLKTMMTAHERSKNVLCFASAGNDNLTTFKALWEFLQDIYDKNSLITCFLLYRHDNLRKHNENVYSLMRGQSDFDGKFAVLEEFIKVNMDDNQVREFKGESFSL